MKIIDCFLFSNELDILEIRLNELNDKVDKFLICESKETFAGNSKELIYEKNKNRFYQFNEKIIHIIVDKFPQNISAENREYFNRNYILNGIPNSFTDEDIIIFSDVDEIPKINNLNKSLDLSVFRQDMYYFNFNTKFIEPNDHANWHGSIAFKAKFKSQVNLQNLRFNRYNINTVVQDGGWHFSYFSNPQNVINKIKNGGHTEMFDLSLNENIIAERIEKRIDVLGRTGYILKGIENNKDLPKYVLDNKEKYRHLFY